MQYAEQQQRDLYTTYMHGRSLETISIAKSLVCTFTSDLRWNDDVNKICNNVNEIIGFLKRNITIGSTEVKEYG